MMTIAVFGASGFIGRNVAARLLARGHRVLGFVRNRESVKDLEAVGLKTAEFTLDNISVATEELSDVTACLHAAASTNPTTSEAHPCKDVADNVLGSIQLAELLARKGVRLIYLSSGGTVYGNACVQPTPETATLSPISFYGLGKATVEAYLDAFAQRGLRRLIVRASNVYGASHRDKPFGIIPLFISRVVDERPITVWGDGSIVRDYLYVDDLVDLLVSALEQDTEGHVNAGSGIGHSVLDIIEMVQDVTGKPAILKFETGREMDVRASVLDITAARDVLGWSPRTSLRQGVDATYTLMQDLHNTKRSSAGSFISIPA